MPMNNLFSRLLGGYGGNSGDRSGFGTEPLSPWAQKMAATGMPSAYWGLPWWKVPSQYWDRDSWQGGITVRDWMMTNPEGDSYADYAAWVQQLYAQGMLDEPWTPNAGMQPKVNNKYYQTYYNTSFNPIYDANGNVVGAARDPYYDPEAYGYERRQPWTLTGKPPVRTPYYTPPNAEPRSLIEQAYDRQRGPAERSTAPVRSPYANSGGYGMTSGINKPATSTTPTTPTSVNDTPRPTRKGFLGGY